MVEGAAGGKSFDIGVTGSDEPEGGSAGRDFAADGTVDVDALVVIDPCDGRDGGAAAAPTEPESRGSLTVALVLVLPPALSAVTVADDALLSVVSRRMLRVLAGGDVLVLAPVCVTAVGGGTEKAVLGAGGVTCT